MTIKSELKQGKAYWFLTKGCKECVGFLIKSNYKYVYIAPYKHVEYFNHISISDIQDYKELGV